MKSLTGTRAKVEALPANKRLLAMSVMGTVGAGTSIGLIELLKDQPNWIKGIIGTGLTFCLYSRVGK